MAIEGLTAFQRKLALIPPRAIAAMRRVMEEAAEQIVADMRRIVPAESGTLRDSIGWTWGDAPGGAMTVGKLSAGKAATSATIGTITVYAGGGDAFYAKFVEFGTAPHIQPKRLRGGTHPGSAAQPFFWPTWRVHRPRMRSKLTREFKKAIREA